MSPGGKRYNPGMDFDTQPEDELLLNLSLEEDDYTDLKAYLEAQWVVEKVSPRETGMAFDHALDPHVLRCLVVKIAHGAVELGNVIAAVDRIIKWVQERNEKKKGKIEAKESKPLLFDHNGHRIDIYPETKKRNKR